MKRISRLLVAAIALVSLSAVSGFAGYWLAKAQVSSIPTTPIVDRSPVTATNPALKKACSSANSITDLEGKKSAAKTDIEYVYDSNCNVLPGADPKSFIALDYYYGKDIRGVWILENPSENGEVKSIQIVGADPASFTLIPVDNRAPSDDEGFSKEYTMDKNHVYSFGQLIDGADPASFAVDSPPRVTSCTFDSHDSHLQFYRGAIVPQAQPPH